MVPYHSGDEKYIKLREKGDPSTPPRPNERSELFKGEEGEI